MPAVTLVRSAIPPVTASVPLPVILVPVNTVLTPPKFCETVSVPALPILTVPCKVFPFCIDSALPAAMFSVPVALVVNAASHDVF